MMAESLLIYALMSTDCFAFNIHHDHTVVEVWLNLDKKKDKKTTLEGY